MDKENEANYFAFMWMNGIAIGFSFEKYKHQNEFVIYLPFIRLAWIKQMMDDNEAEQFLNE